MPLLRTIKKLEATMRNQGIKEEIIDKFHFQKADTEEKIIELVNKMDELLSKEQCLSIMEQHGCCKTGKVNHTSIAFNREHNKKTLEEKIALIPQSNIAYKMQCRLNANGTITIFDGDDAVYQEGSIICGCYTIRNLPQPVNVSKTYCGCCGGLYRHMFQNALGVKLQLIEIVETKISSRGKKNKCEFVYKIID